MKTGMDPDAGWIWLVHYLFDLEPPAWLPASMRQVNAPPPPLPGVVSDIAGVPRSGSAVAPAPVSLDAPRPPPVLSGVGAPSQVTQHRQPVPTAPPTPPADDSAFAHVEEYVQLTEKELQAQVAAAEELIRRSLALRMAKPSTMLRGDDVDTSEGMYPHKHWCRVLLGLSAEAVAV
jgi:hypothetical protein